MSRLYIGDVDLSSVFQPYSSGPPTETRFYVNNVDIGSIFQLYGVNKTSERILENADVFMLR